MPEVGSIRAWAEFLQVGLPMQHFRDMAERVLPQYRFEQPMAPTSAAGCTVVLDPPRSRRSCWGEWILELGGKPASIILPDADLDRAVPSVVVNMTAQAGQGCSLLTRTLVHESLFDELVGRVKVEGSSRPPERGSADRLQRRAAVDI